MLRRIVAAVVVGLLVFTVFDATVYAKGKPRGRRVDRDNNPPGPKGGKGTNWENPPGPKGGPGASPDRRRHTAHRRRWRRRFARLSDEKKAAIKAVLQEAREKIKAVRQNEDLTPKEKKAAIRDILKEARRKIRKILGEATDAVDVVDDGDDVVVTDAGADDDAEGTRPRKPRPRRRGRGGRAGGAEEE